MIWFFYALLSAFSDSFSRICDKKASEVLDPTLSTLIYYLVETAIFILFSLSFKKSFFTALQGAKPYSIAFVIASSIIGSLSWFFYIYALRHGSITQVSLAQQLSLIFSIALSAIIMGDVIKPLQAIGALLILIGSALVARC